LSGFRWNSKAAFFLINLEAVICRPVPAASRIRPYTLRVCCDSPPDAFAFAGPWQPQFHFPAQSS
jgi:hypothetical protein